VFNSLAENLSKVFSKLTSIGYIKEQDVDDALREIRRALLEADVALPVVKELTSRVKERAIGEKLLASITPGQMVIKIVQDCLEEILTLEGHELNLATKAPAVILMVGLQGSGKTTTTAKLARNLKKAGKKVYLASLDTYRPAAQEQLAVLARQVGVDSAPIKPGEKPLDIAKRALKEAEFSDVLLLDTAGRLHIDSTLMQELVSIKEITNPIETLLVADSLTGQDAIHIAQEFNTQVPLTGIILTRVDSDARGGAALSMSYVTKTPIKFIGVGERIDDLEEFYPDRIASRILGFGDIVSLVEKAQEVGNKQESEELFKRAQKGTFNLNNLSDQLKSMKKLGGISSVLKMIPGMGKLAQTDGMDDSSIDKQIAIIASMTKLERLNPHVLNASRKIRVAKGSGTSVNDVNKLVKQFLKMQKMLKKVANSDQQTLMRGGLNQLLRGL
jgi:signal recognition particle subunit SRP54